MPDRGSGVNVPLAPGEFPPARMHGYHSGMRLHSRSKCCTASLRLVGLLLAVAACGHARSEATVRPLNASEGYVPVEGGQLHYRIAGRGADTVLVVHGGPGFDMNYLFADLQPLARRHVLVFYDQLGTGLSTVAVDSTELTVERFVADLDAVRSHFGISRLELLGHSWGAGLAALYAEEHPEHVRSLILVDAMPSRREPWAEQFDRELVARRDSAALVRLPRLGRALRTASDSGYANACRAFGAVLIQSYLADTTAAHRMHGDLCSAPVAALRNGSHVSKGILASLGAWDFRASLSRVTVPTLVIHGDRDPIPLGSAREWAAGIPGARLLVIAGSGHFPWIEQPEAFFPAVETFMSGGWPNAAEVVRMGASAR